MQPDRNPGPELAPRALNLNRSAIRVVFDAAEGREGIIRLEIGEPSFPTPPHIIEAAADAARHGFTKYTPNGGFASLRTLLADKIARVDGYRVEPNQVVVTPGGMNALFAAYLALLSSGDEVLLPSPGFPNMDGMVQLLGGTAVFYELRKEEGYLPSIPRLESLITRKTRALFINTPGNPTGAVFPASLVEELVDLCRRRNLWLISDEVYDELILDKDLQHVAAARFDTDARVISVYSFSKVYAMTGWRVGYCVASPVLADVLRKLQEPMVSCPSAVSQKAAEAALVGDQSVVALMRTEYTARRDEVWRLIEELGLKAFRTKGTFYMLLDIAEGGLPSFDFAMRLLAEGVAVAPGEVFGPAGKGLVRISLANESRAIQEGVTRIAKLLKELAGRGGLRTNDLTISR